MASTDMGGLVDRLGAEAVECRALIREMHEAQKDLRAEIREAQRVMAELKVAAAEFAATDVNALLMAEVVKVLGEFGEKTKAHIDKTARKISAEFERLTQPMLKTLGLLEVASDVHVHAEAMAAEYQRHIDELAGMSEAEAIEVSKEWHRSHDWRVYRDAWVKHGGERLVRWDGRELGESGD